MINKRGGIVAIEPKTGEILAPLPHHDPSILVGRQRSKNYTLLYDSIAKPLYDRGLLAEYPPDLQNINWSDRPAGRRNRRTNHFYVPSWF
jgi:hypothetical protein